MSIYALLWLTLISFAFGRPVDLSPPQNHLGAASYEGYVQFWREVDQIDTGQGFDLPLRIQFSSGRDYSSPFLGKGWWMPLLESTEIQTKETVIKTNLLCGKTLYLHRSRTDGTKFQSPDGQWKGVVKDGGGLFVSRDDGWEMTFQDGKLQRLTTDSHRTFDWIYENGIAAAIKEEGSAQTLVSVHKDAQGAPDGVTANNKLYKFSLAKRPQVAVIADQFVVQGFDQALNQWTWPDGRREAFDFAIEKSQPDLTFIDSGKKETRYVWDAKTKRIASGGDWKYTIETLLGNDIPKITRTDSTGKSESSSLDVNAGTETFVTDGKEKVFYQITTPGPLYDKIRKVDEITGTVTNTIYRAAYNDAGNLLRQTDAKGITTVLNYDQAGKVISKSSVLPSDPTLLAKLKDKEKAFLTAIDLLTQEDVAVSAFLQKLNAITTLADRDKLYDAMVAGKPMDQVADIMRAVQAKNDSPVQFKRDKAIKNLVSFYLNDLKQPDKAAKLLAQISPADKSARFYVELDCIDKNEGLSRNEKLQKLKTLLATYPEQQKLINFVIQSWETGKS